MNADAKRQVNIEPDEYAANELAAELFGTIVCQAVADSGQCSVALAGGTTPHALYQLLASQAPMSGLPWDRLEVFWGDERDVPHDHVESNYGMAQRTLLDHVPVPPTQIHPMPADAQDIQSAAAEYEQVIRRVVPAGPDGTPQFDLILLGVGGDGHTASLFPDTPAVDETEKLVMGQHVSVLGRSRMTFTFPLINAARNVLFQITGEDKAEVVADLLSEQRRGVSKLPAARVQPAGKLYVVLDRDAARKAEAEE